MSRDRGVQKAAALRLIEEEGRKRLKFRPAVLVNSIMLQDHSRSRRVMSATARSLLADVEDTERHQKLRQLPAQGDMARSWENTSPELWVRAVRGLPPETMKFALNASLNTLPTNANLHMWGKKPTNICPLCQESRQSLVHILNNCPVALELRRYSKRHDTVLQVIGDFIRSHLPPQFSISIDSPSEAYSSPTTSHQPI